MYAQTIETEFAMMTKSDTLRASRLGGRIEVRGGALLRLFYCYLRVGIYLITSYISSSGSNRVGFKS